MHPSSYLLVSAFNKVCQYVTGVNDSLQIFHYRVKIFRSIFNYYIVSLCVSDFIASALVPLHAYRRLWGFVKWNIPSALCKVCNKFLYLPHFRQKFEISMLTRYSFNFSRYHDIYFAFLIKRDRVKI